MMTMKMMGSPGYFVVDVVVVAAVVVVAMMTGPALALVLLRASGKAWPGGAATMTTMRKTGVPRCLYNK